MHRAVIVFSLLLAAGTLALATPDQPSNWAWKNGEGLQDGHTALPIKSSPLPSLPRALHQIHLGEKVPRRLATSPY
jgi:hypothetical protein